MKRPGTLLLILLCCTTIFAQTRIFQTTGVPISYNDDNTPFIDWSRAGDVTVDDLGNGTYRIEAPMGLLKPVSWICSNPQIIENSTVSFDCELKSGRTVAVTIMSAGMSIDILQIVFADENAFAPFLQKIQDKLSTYNSPSIKGDINLPELLNRPFGVKIDAGEAFTAATIIKSAKSTYGWNVAQFDRTGIGFKWENLNGLSLFGYPLSFLKTDTSLTTDKIWKGIIMGQAIYPTKSDGAKLRKRITSVMLAAGWTQYENSHDSISFYKGTAMASFWFMESSCYKGKYECGFQSEIFESADIVRYRMENGVS